MKKNHEVLKNIFTTENTEYTESYFNYFFSLRTLFGSMVTNS